MKLRTNGFMAYCATPPLTAMPGTTTMPDSSFFLYKEESENMNLV